MSTAQKTEIRVGEIIETNVEIRDAIHVPVISFLAIREMRPGETVGQIGIIDPFLKENVKPGQKCWLFLKPGSITALRHVWEHPFFAESRESRECPSNGEQKLSELSVTQ